MMTAEVRVAVEVEDSMIELQVGLRLHTLTPVVQRLIRRSSCIIKNATFCVWIKVH